MSTPQEILSDENKLYELTKLVFDKADVNCTGFIDRKELAATMELLARDGGIPPPAPEQVETVLKHLDTNQDGVIQLEEFKTFMIEILKKLS